MIRDLMTPEAQTDPYVWSAALLAHAAIGVAMWALLGWWALAAYAAFEAVQARVSGVLLIWDSILDWCAVALGACLGWALWSQSTSGALGSVAAVAVIAAVGAARRPGGA